MMRLTRYLAICLLVLLASAEVAWAQNDAQYVIKTKVSDHYLAHVKVGDDWVLQDATEFSPNCLWYSGIEHNISGTTHNYYFIDENGVYHYLSAPLQAESPLGLSNSMPPTYLLSNTDQVYYFYDWDSDNGSDGGGVARGHQYSLAEGACTSADHQWSEGECWDVFWVAYNNSGWTTSVNSYDIDDLPATYVGGRYHIVTATDYKTHVSGGIGNLSDMEMTFNSSQALTAPVTLPYIFKKYTHYHFVENRGTKESPNLVVYNYYYYDGNIHDAEPTDAIITESSVKNYEWSLTGDGAQYLSFASESELLTIQGASPTLYYRVNNQTGNKVAVLKLKITYENGETQETTANVIVTTECQNPPQYAAPVVSYEDVLITWHHIAESYRVYWKKASESSFVQNEDVPTNYHIFSDLESNTEYQYKVYAICNGSEVDDPEPTVYSFTTLEEHDLLVYGSVFGGGRMADVSGNTEVVVVNANSIGSIYGGNDIAGTVHGAEGSAITIGVNTGDGGTTQAPITIGSVYGGGNGYYSYGSTTFAPIAHDATTATIAAGQGIYALNPEDNIWNISEWTNGSSVESTISIPSITKTAITVNNDYITIDTLFGGAKNAFVTNAVADANGTSVTIYGGTIHSLFGGNNVGGTQTAGKHHIVVDEGDKSPSGRYATRIHTLFGGGNMVQGSITDISINGGMIDTLYAGGNAASVAAANVTVDCDLASGSGNTFGKTYSSAIESTDGSTITVKDDYTWDCSVDYDYNIRALFGGNNKAAMNVVPSITLTSGSIGILYGGGNAGDMVADNESYNTSIADDFGPLIVDFSTNPNTTSPINISTHVELSSPKVLIDYLYGGCQMSDVRRSTWVEMSDGHVGTVYGGCNISGDVGSRYLFGDGYNYRPKHERYQATMGATYVKVSGGHIYRDLFAGGNGRYHCNDGKYYVEGIDFDNIDIDGKFIGMPVPTHNETHVYVSGGEVKGSVYAGGNLACVGFINETAPTYKFYTPVFVGFATMRMSGGTVRGNVFGGGNMASIWGSNGVSVEGGTIEGALYGGNDRIGLVAQITNRVLPPSYTVASDGYTSLDDVRTYISLTGRPEVNTVYGGGNGNYDYEHGMYCNSNDQPVQSNTFVDVNIDGFTDGSHPAGHIGTVYGGGDGVTITGTATVFLNVKGDNEGNVANVDHVGTIFGGNNKGPLDILPDIVLLKGHVNTVYGGCNQGAMEGSHSRTVAGTTYNNLSSMVRLRDSYTAGGNTVIPSAVVTGAVYGGCRMNGVTNNTLVLVEHGTHPANFFGGSDISGTVGGTSHVVVTGDGQTGNIFGGGNGNYDYVNDNVNSSYKVYIAGSNHNDPAKLVVSGNSAFTAPECATSVVDILGGQVGASGNGNGKDIYGGGWGSQTSTTGNVEVNIGLVDAASAAATPTVYGNIYGGSALGSVNSSNSNSNSTTVNFLNGTLHGNLFGGGLGLADVYEEETLTVDNSDKGKTYGKVFVNISNSSQAAANCFIDLRDASIYGCNNTNGSPQDDVEVHVYKTAFNYSDYASGDNYTAASGTHPNYAIANVFGGGNLAGYQPAGDNKTLVYVHGCLNTIGRLFGGGNAAVSLHASTIVEGGRFDQVFGGGNGESSPADIGTGGIELAVSGGKIRQLFGGNNTSGEISGPMTINVTNSGSCTEDITEFFGGSNAAPMGTAEDPVTLTTTIGCNTNYPVAITNVYGGSNLAAITGNVTLTIEGGTFTNVYAGSKGVAGTAADITGNTTLNLYGGTITNAFGGNNVNGNITGGIAVNVLDYEDCPLNVANIYGASNATAYAPTDPSSASPVINLMHVKEGSTVTNLFGGGNQGEVTANPVVNIGYVAETMAGLVPGDYPGTSTFHTAPRAYVSGNVYGGGNEAGVGSPTVNMTSGTVANDVYGGCNSNGTVTGDIAVNLMGGTVGQDVFGGGKGNATRTNGDVTVTIDGGTVTQDVYGGSALGQVNTGTSNLTKVWLKSGTVTGSLYGGGMGQAETADYGQVNGNVEVHVEGGTVANVFGCNNYNEEPVGYVKVYIDETAAPSTEVTGNVYGGGNVASYDQTPEVYIQNGIIRGKVFGGGNNITVSNKGVAGSNVQMTGGVVLQGIFGGCNDDGDVTGNSVVTIIGGTIGATSSRASIHGGGYGAATTVAGDVTVTFGEASNVHTDDLILYGDLYGGSALGTVNTSNANTTTVNVLNGIITGTSDNYLDYGNIFGGGLGDATHAAVVNGKVYVYIGNSSTGGKASLAHCNVYGCNNVNGSPQDVVEVDVYETAHILQNEANYYEPDNSFAIYQVFGGGNEANYAPQNGNENSALKTHVTIHGCDNTVMYVYGGSNAADAVGVVTIIEGGRFSQVYGGGNGTDKPANIGKGGIGLNAVAGNVGYLIMGSNRHGNNVGPTYEPPANSDCLGGLFVDSYFFGANEAELYGDLTNYITCADAGNFEYKRVYAGSRWGTVYGDINLMVSGGTIENLFGGCQGEDRFSADVRRFPADATEASDPRYSDGVRAFLASHPEYYGRGGNINLVITGGTIGNVFGGCDYKGNVEGQISVLVSESDDASCPLFIGNIYGGSNHWAYNPLDDDITSPDVRVVKGVVGGSNLYLPVNNIYGVPATEYEGNVFGGGNQGNVTAHPRVIVGDGTTGSSATRVTIKGDVYGGGNEGNVTGNPHVIIVPQQHTLTITTPSNGTISVKNSHNGDVPNGASIGEGIDLNLTAVPESYAYRLSGWTVTGGATLSNADATNTIFTMGSADATIGANFTPVTTHSLTFSAGSGGSVKVTGFKGDVTSGTAIGEGTILTLEAASDNTHKFTGWTVTGTGSTVASASSAKTTFTMGTADATITANYTDATTHSLAFDPSPTGGSFTVKGYNDGSVSSGASIGEGTVLSLDATPSAGYAFKEWTVTGTGASVGNQSSPTTTFTMGSNDASIVATFAPTHTLAIATPSNGYIKVLNKIGLLVNNGDKVGENAKLNIKATPAPGYAFSGWTITGATVENDNTAIPVTNMTMGNTAASIAASFIAAHLLTVVDPPHVVGDPSKKQGAVKVTGIYNQSMASPATIGEEVQVSIEAIPSAGYTFSGWQIVEGDGVIQDASSASTKFTMKTQNTTIKANFTRP